MPVIQSQKTADEKTDNPPVGEGDDGRGGIGGDPPGNSPDPFAEVIYALAAGEGEILIEGGPVVDGGRVGGRDICKTHPFPTAEIDLPEVGVDVADHVHAEGDSGGLAGPEERAAEDMRPFQTPELSGEGRRLVLPTLGERHIRPADVTAAAAFSEISMADQDHSARHR